MLVIVMLSAIGVLALNAASYDMASTGVISDVHGANNIAGGAMGLARCEMCESIDGIALSMQSMREARGHAPQFLMTKAVLESDLDNGPTLFLQPDSTEHGRGAFGSVDDTSGYWTVNPPDFDVRIDRPRESSEIEGFSLRESAGSDTSAFCFRTYRVTSRGSLVPPSHGAVPPGTTAQHRAYIVTGPLQCSF
jgi:hypothetical protein